MLVSGCQILDKSKKRKIPYYIQHLETSIQYRLALAPEFETKT